MTYSDTVQALVRCNGWNNNGHRCNLTTLLTIGPDYRLAQNWYCPHHRKEQEKQ